MSDESKKPIEVGEYRLTGANVKVDHVEKPKESVEIKDARAIVKELEAKFREKYGERIQGGYAVADFIYTYSKEVPGLSEVEKKECKELLAQLLMAYRKLRMAIEGTGR